jgi:hypothetical protein
MAKGTVQILMDKETIQTCGKMGNCLVVMLRFSAFDIPYIMMPI